VKTIRDMEKEFIPCDLALRLKELGFDEPCFAYCDGNNSFIIDRNSKVIQKNSNYIGVFEGVISRPTFSQAFRWFRENYKLHSTIDGFGSDIDDNIHYFEYYIYKTQTDRILHQLNRLENGTIEFTTREEAELSCLDKLIEIIENNKTKDE
jgi:hypothetical protein